MSWDVSLIVHQIDTLRGRKVEVFINKIYKFYIYTKKLKEKDILEDVKAQLKIEKQLLGGF